MSAKKIAIGAIAIALSLVSFTLFKGVTNVLNAFIIPLILSVLLFNFKTKEFLATIAGLFLFTVIFFPIQVFFVSAYFLISFLLILFDNKKLSKVVLITLLSFCLTSLFSLAIVFTDFVFNTQMQSIMMSVFNENIALYYGVIFFEAVIISALQVICFKLFAKRFKLLIFSS